MGERISNMRLIVLVVVLVSLVLLVSQGPTGDFSSILKEVKKRYAKLEKEIKDMSIVEEMKMVTSQGKMTSEARVLKKGKKFRTETKMHIPQTSAMPQGMPEMETVIIYDGKDTWRISSFMGKEKLSDEEAKEYRTERKWWWEFLSEKAKIVGTEKVGKRECYVVEIKEEREAPFIKVWLEKKNLVLIKGQSKGPSGENIFFVCSDFRKIKGDWEMPYKTEVYVGGKLMSTYFVKSFEINKGLSDDLFDPDKVKVKTFNMQEMM